MMAETGCWIVPPLEGRVRLDQFMVRLLPDQSRSCIQNWIRSARLRVNKAAVKTGEILRAGDSITLALPPDELPAPFPEDIPIFLHYEDSDIAVVEKPAGLVCHLGAGIRSGTLVNALLHRFGPIVSGNPDRPGIVHRLDKPTSGLLVVARNETAHRRLSLQFQNREVKKEYLALVHGVPRPPAGTIDLPLGRDPMDRKKISVRARRRRSAITHYQTEKIYGCASLLRVQIETGRTHQIRVHLAQKGYPVVGDRAYGGDRNLKIPAAIRGKLPDRMFLHAHRLEFRHPGTGAHMRFSSPLPGELAAFLELLAENP